MDREKKRFPIVSKSGLAMYRKKKRFPFINRFFTIILCFGVLPFLCFNYYNHNQDVARIESEFEEVADAEKTGVFHSPEVFELDYAKMTKEFKVYSYPGIPNAYDMPMKLTGKYASERFFFRNLRESQFRTDDPDQADLFFIPISCAKMRGKGIHIQDMKGIVRNYVESLIIRYPYWNRTLGADHFFVTCHEIGVEATFGLHFLAKNSIRVVCSASYDLGFIPHKDIALPRVLQPFALPAGGNDLENRTHLGFWTGDLSSKIGRTLGIILKNDTEFSVSMKFRAFKSNRISEFELYTSKYCLSPGSSHIDSRIVESIHYGCIPVILSDYYNLPFSSILAWKNFAVIMKESDVYRVKQALKDINEEKFLALHNNLIKVQRHFQWNSPPIEQDSFHMIMYELWTRRHTIRY